MTIESKRLIDLTDLLAVEYKCRACNVALVIPREKWRATPQGCPHCKQVSADDAPWFPPDRGDRIDGLLRKLFNAISDLAEESEARNFDLRFVVAANE